MAGRDIGTVILPDADLKIYLDAAVEERARRRASERGLSAGEPESDAVLEGLRRRDELDATREVAPLRVAADAVVIRSDGNTLEQTVDEVVQAVERATRLGGAPTPAVVPAPRAAPPSSRLTPARRPLPATRIADRLTPLILTCSLVGRFLAGAFTRVRIEGDLGAVPSTGPVLVIANHASNADGLVMGAFLPPRIGRPFNWLGKREMFDVPVLGWLAVRGGVHAVERSAVDLDAFRTAQRILDAGQVLAVFPEGTRSPTGAMQPVKDGLAMLAQRSGVPIVPIAIEGSDLVWPKGRRLPRIGGRITVRVGPPFALSDEPSSMGSGRREAKTAATRRMMGAVARLRGAYTEPDRAG
jgi:1-acyl-sn-glycerol-3-phosphate acyltransferase